MKHYLLFALLASFFAVAPAFSVTCDSCGSCACECPPEPCCEFELPSAPDICGFNAGAFKDIKCSWDIFATGSFLYWQASEGGLDPASFAVLPTGEVTDSFGFSFVSPIMEFDYKPALKVGLGVFFCKDNWSLYTEYLWYHNTPGHITVPATGEHSINYLSLFFLPFIPINEELDLAVDLSATWKLSLNRVDLQLGRNYFVGQCLTFNSHVGLRAAWINQTYTTQAHIIEPSRNSENSVDMSLDYTVSSDNWGVGAVAGLDTNWALCLGFRLFANMEGSILYTRYTNIEGNGTLMNSAAVTSGIPDIAPTYSLSRTCLSPELGISLGLGYGDYLDCNNWHLDVAVSYDFNVFWNQNGFPRYALNAKASPFSYEDLFLNGLTVTVTVEF